MEVGGVEGRWLVEEIERREEKEKDGRSHLWSRSEVKFVYSIAITFLFDWSRNQCSRIGKSIG